MSLLNYLKTRKIELNDALNRTVSRQEMKAAQAELARKRKLRWPNPLKTIHIILEKDVGLLLLYNSLVYTAFYDVTASLPSQFAEIYGFNELQIGFVSLPPKWGSHVLILFQVDFHSIWSWVFNVSYFLRAIHS